MQRYFINNDLHTEEFELPEELYHHVMTVMRAKVHTKFEVVGPDQQVKVVELTQVTPNAARARVIKDLKQNVELPLNVTILCGISKADKAEKIVQKGTEMGASKFIFFNSERSVARWDEKKAPKKLSRLQKIARGAAEQAHRQIIPELNFCPSLSQALAQTSNASYRLAAYEESAKAGEKSKLAQLLQEAKKHMTADKKQEIAGFFGPEGGFSPEESDLFGQQEVLQVGLGPRIMRAETAPLYLLAAISFSLELE
ncbi:16S rRNA methyltransferase [Ligilactobacillus salitolerans]|uniref:Ribosomal RNA small subunit methyltransferase E n=1 Tax=Ligilactobacillus salitolerans TaxID=1808352 RepID=A0A401ITZ1_9LACO|nr:16S rRNA (uracil(1498)-N(3))-methyltransferase [Ligilactobacillus salitolerans]GBG95002.1 16S rRNA methyltransferase [Ligilactobacillus salitolerans]